MAKLLQHLFRVLVCTLFLFIQSVSCIFAQQGGFEQVQPNVQINSAPPNDFPSESNIDFSGSPNSLFSCEPPEQIGNNFEFLLYLAFAPEQSDNLPENQQPLPDQSPFIPFFKTVGFNGTEPSETTPSFAGNKRIFSAGDLNWDGCDEILTLTDDSFADESRTGVTITNIFGDHDPIELPEEVGEILQDFINKEKEAFESIELELETEFTFDSFLTDHDYDGDGFDDLLVGLESEPTDRFDVAFGNFMLNILDFHSFSMTSLDDPIPGLNETTRFNAADIDKDGDSEVIVFSTETSQESGFMGRVRTFDIDADRVGTLIQDVRLSVSLTIDANRYNFYALDIDGADEPNPIELLLVPPQFIFDFDLPGAEVMVIDADPTTGEFHDTPLPFAMGFITPLGDLNDDGRHDFLWGDENGKPFISYGPSSLASGLSFDNELPPGDDPDFEFKHPPFIRAGTYGDLNNDGIDDAIIGHTEKTNIKVGRRFVFGSSSGNLSSEFALYDRNVFFNTFASSANVGDVNGDGFEDFAIVRQDEYQVDIFFGREVLSLAPDVVLQADRSRAKPVQVISGDFNGDGFSDVAVKVLNGIATDVYFGGPDMDGEPDHRFDPASAQTITDPESNQINPANIGDVNDDGIDDFLIDSGFAQDDAGNFLNQAWIFYGGSTLSSGPDLTIDYNDDPNLSGNFRNVAPSAAYGDFNGDGINDLALEMGTIVTDNFVTGGAYLYFGNGMAKPQPGQANTQVSDIDFSAPDLILRPDFQDVTNMTASGVAAGDFDGDGIADLAMGINDLAGDGTESPVIQIFKGGDAIDDAADVELTAPADLFGGELGMFFNRVLGFFEFLPDDDGDGIQNLLMATAGGFVGGTNAAVYAGGTGPASAPAQVLVAPNPTIGLGGRRSVATGDFNNDGNNDIVLVQTFDNRDSFRSSRAYLYSPNADNVAVPIEKDEFTGPESFALSQNFPNPFNPSTTIQFTLPRAANVTLKVYDLLGREVTTLINNEQMTAGTRTVQFDASSLATGMYLYRLEAENFVQIRKMMLIK